MKQLLTVTVAVVMLGGALLGCGDPEPDSHDITGTLTLIAEDFAFSAQDEPFWTVCSGEGGYSDVAPGSQITITDESGDIIGAGALANLTTDDTPPLSLVKCVLTFDAEVPDATFYTFSLGSRKGLTVSNEDMASNGWHVDMELGQRP